MPLSSEFVVLIFVQGSSFDATIFGFFVGIRFVQGTSCWCHYLRIFDVNFVRAAFLLPLSYGFLVWILFKAICLMQQGLLFGMFWNKIKVSVLVCFVMFCINKSLNHIKPQILYNMHVFQNSSVEFKEMIVWILLWLCALVMVVGQCKVAARGGRASTKNSKNKHERRKKRKWIIIALFWIWDLVSRAQSL